MSKTDREGKSVVELLGNIMLGGGLALAVCCVFLFLAAVAISMGWLKDGMIRQLTVAGCVIGTAAGTLFAIKRCKSRVLLVGLAVAGVFFLLLLTIGMITYESMSVEQGGASLLCGSLCGGAVTGLLCSRPKKKKRK